MKKLDHVATLQDGSQVFFVAFNDNAKDPYSGYFATSFKTNPSIDELKPVALNEIKNNDDYLSDEEKALIYARHLNFFGKDALNDCIKGCVYDIKLHGKECFAFELNKACKLMLLNK
jgi:hypothetical protein